MGDVNQRIKTVHICMCTGILLNVFVAILNYYEHKIIGLISNVGIIIYMIGIYIFCLKMLNKQNDND